MAGPVLEELTRSTASRARKSFSVRVCTLGLVLLLSGAVLTLPFVVAFSGSDPWTEVMRHGPVGARNLATATRPAHTHGSSRRADRV
jgi:hypothetical protein